MHVCALSLAGLFECPDWVVFGSTKIPPCTHVMNGLQTQVASGGRWNTALNTPVFVAVWKQVLQLPQFKAHAWTVKVDPDTVFFPSRLGKFLPKSSASFLINCNEGLHGPIEVVSRAAVQKVDWESYLHLAFGCLETSLGVMNFGMFGASEDTCGDIPQEDLTDKPGISYRVEQCCVEHVRGGWNQNPVPSSSQKFVLPSSCFVKRIYITTLHRCFQSYRCSFPGRVAAKLLDAGGRLSPTSLAWSPPGERMHAQDPRQLWTLG